MPELDIASDKIAEVIILARRIDRAEILITDIDRPDFPEDDLTDDEPPELEGDLGEDEFDAFVGAMTVDEIANLVAIMWIGRGTYDPAEWDDALNAAMAEATVPTAEYLKGTPHLADHLEAGLEALGIDPTEAEDDLY